jgi:hypothetical protein
VRGSGGSRPLGLYWGAVAIALTLVSPLASRAAALVPPCLFRSVTGLPCPTCGGTRAGVALSRLDLAGAFAFNPLVTIGGIAFLLGGIAAGAAALAGRPLSEPSRYGLRVRLAALLAVALNWAWLLLRSSSP